MRILIAGGLGFIGARVANHLQLAGHKIILGSRKCVEVPSWLPNAEMEKMEWDDGDSLKRICKGVDVVIQAAGMNAQSCVVNPTAALEFNGMATKRLVTAANQSGVKRFIYLSTAHVYASPLTGKITEDIYPKNPHPYATSHLAGENAILSTAQHGDIEVLVLRLANTFGAPMHKATNCWMLLVNDLCRQAIETRKIVLKTNGLQQRDFISLDNVSNVIEALISCDLINGKSAILNVGSGISQSVLEMARKIQQRCSVVLGFEPELKRLKIGLNDIGNLIRLEYRQDRLAKICKVTSVDNSAEIDRLLLFSQDAFEYDETACNELH